MNRTELVRKVDLAIENQISQRGYTAVVDVLMEIGCLSRKDYLEWRSGRIPYLEKVCSGSLSRLSFINQEFRKHAKKLGCHESFTYYRQWGKGKTKLLQFSKYNDPAIERMYATHYVHTERISELKKMKELKNTEES